MAFDTYMTFIDPSGKALQGESQVAADSFAKDDLAKQAPPVQAGNVFEIDDFSFDIEQVLNIGSQSSGAGAGKVTFNPFQVTRKTDRASPKLFMMCCGGQHFKQVVLCIRRAGGDTSTSGTTFLRFDFGLVAVKTISWSGSDGDEFAEGRGHLRVWRAEGAVHPAGNHRSGHGCADPRLLEPRVEQQRVRQVRERVRGHLIVVPGERGD